MDFAHEQQALAYAISGNPERAAELIEVDILAREMQMGRSNKAQEMLATASPEVIEQAIALNLERERETSAQVAAGTIAGALLTAPAAPAAIAKLVQTGRLAGAELTAFVANPVNYCRLNPTLCLNIVEEVGYTATGAVGVGSIIPDVPLSSGRQFAGSVGRSADEVVDGLADGARVGDDLPRVGGAEVNSSLEGFRELSGIGADFNSADLPDGFRRVADPDGNTVVVNQNNQIVLSGKRTDIPSKSDDVTRRSLIRENESADILSQNGFIVEQNPVISGPKNPDFRVNGEIFDNLAPATSSPRNIASRVEEKVLDGQTARVVINIKDSDVSIGALRAQFKEFPILGLEDVLVIDKQGTITRILD